MIKKLIMRIIVPLTFVFLVPLIVLASNQDKAVEEIRRAYDDIGKKIELSEKGIEDSQYSGIFCNEVEVNRNKHVWPVVGNYALTYKFYYELAHTEGHPYPDRLRKVVMKSSMSDRSYYSEYFFDEAGALVFYFTRPNEPPIGDEPQRMEQRIYYARGRPIRMINGQKTVTQLTTRDVAGANRVLAESRQIKELFARSLALPSE